MTIQHTCGAGVPGNSPAQSSRPFHRFGASQAEFAGLRPFRTPVPMLRRSRCTFLLAMMLMSGARTAPAQVGPAEITNPQLKSLETSYLPQLSAMREAITKLKFPFGLLVSRYVALDPKQQAGADARGLEFVLFHNHTVLKISANYNAAYDSALLTRNQRAGHVFNEVVVPILRLIPDYFTLHADFDRFGFEISYHVRARSSSYDYEGKEILVVVLDKTKAFGYPDAHTDSQRQSIVNASEIYVNGEEFGLALNAAQPFSTDELASLRLASAPQGGGSAPAISAAATASVPAGSQPPGGGTTSLRPEIAALQRRLQPGLDNFAREGNARYHFIDYAPPSFFVFRDRIYLQMTLRNPKPFDGNSTSIYKRAAQSFDLFLAPMLKSLFDAAPVAQEIAGFDVTVLNELGLETRTSPEALELIFPLEPLRRFTAAEITNQDLIDQSIVMVNGVRIALNLMEAEREMSR